MKKLRFILLSIVVLLVSGRAAAYDFVSGGLYYNILDADAKTVEVTSSGGDEYTGDIVIPHSVTYGNVTYYVKAIGEKAFYDRSLQSVTIEDGVETIGNQAFWDSDGINKLVLPSTLKTIGDEAFTWAYITTLDLPEGVTSIGRSAFSSCHNLVKVILPSTITTLGNSVFNSCGSLTNVVSHIVSPPEINTTVFGNTGVTTLYVPVGTKSAYEAISGWTVFANIFEGDLQEYTTPDGLTYEFNATEGFASVVVGNYSDLKSITIPGSVVINGKTYSVKSVDANAFANCRSLESLVIDEGIESIGRRAFYSCRSLASVQLPSTLRTIGDQSFYDCDGFKVIDIPEGVTTIGSQTFQSCSNLQKVILPSTITSIGHWAFIDLYALTAVVSHMTVPVNVELGDFARNGNWNSDEQKYDFINSNAILYVPNGTSDKYKAIEGWTTFADIIEGEPKEVTIDGLTYSYLESNTYAKLISGDYSNLESVTIPGSINIDGINYTVKEISGRAFYQCSNLKSLIISEGVEFVGERAFYNCSNLTSIQFPSSLRTIGEWAFYNTYQAPNIILPEGLETIEASAFYWTNSKLVDIPSTVKSIGERAFYHLNNNATVKSRIKAPFAIKPNVFARDTYWENDAEVFTPMEGMLYVPVGTSGLYQSLAGWMVIGDVMEGEPQEGTGNDGFNYSYTTESKEAILIRGNYNDLPIEFTVPATTTIGGAVYSVVSIAAEVFSNRDFTSVVIPNGVRSIGRYAFRDCQQMTSLSLPQSLTKIGEEAFAYCYKLTSLSIPAKVGAIGDHAFGFCSSLVSIKVDAANAYYDSRNNCNALIETASNKLIKATASTVIPNGVVEIGSQAFYNLKNLMGISIPSSVTTIGYSAFADCDALTSIYIPSSVTRIESEAFNWCDALATVKVDPNNTVYDSRNGCNAIIETANNRLIFGCKNTVVPRGIKILGDAAFRGCTGLDSLKLPYGVEKLEWGSLSYNDLKYVEIPNSVKEFANYVFEGCDNIVSIVSKIKSPFSINGYYIFNYGNLFNRATLYVPKGKKEAYQNAGGWDFQNIEEMDGQQLATPTLSFDGRYVTATTTDKDVDMYYGMGGKAPSIYYDGPITVSDLGTVSVIAEKSFASDSEVATKEIEYFYNGDTLKLSSAGHISDAIKWCGADKVEKMTVVGPINSSEFETIRTMQNLKFLNLAEATGQLSIPDNAFANSNLVSFVAPASLSSVGSGIFSNCQQLAAVCWNTSAALPADALNGVNNPNLLLYVQNASDAPTSVHNVVVNGTANDIALSDATGNNNFYVPVAFTAKKISYTRNFQQKTEVGVSCGWETIALPFNVGSIVSEKLGSDYTPTPFNSYRNYNRQRPFWLYTLNEYNDNYISPASSISANVPYLICMPNADVYADDYNLNGNITFSAENVNVAVSDPIQKTKGSVSFIPAYQRMDASSDVFALNVNQEYKGYPAGSLFVNNFREVRPFEAYSLHPSTAVNAPAIAYTVSSLIGGNSGDTTGIIDVMLKKNDGSDGNTLVKVYSLSGALIKQAKADDVTKGLPKGVYIANGKKFVVK